MHTRTSSNVTGLRPAIHLSGKAIREALGINAGFTPESSQYARMTINGEQVTQGNFNVDRNGGEKTIVIDAGALNSVTNITVTYGSHTLVLTPADNETDLSAVYTWNPNNDTDPLVTFRTWYGDAEGRVVNLKVYSPQDTFNITVTTTNNWMVTRNYSFPLGASPTPGTVMFTGNYASVIDAPVQANYIRGHTFLGWYTAPTGDATGVRVTGATVVSNLGNYDVDTPVARITTLYARWSVHIATIHRIHHGGGAPEVLTATRVFSAVLHEPEGADRPSGHTFEGWFTAPVGGERFTVNCFITADQDGDIVRIYARWIVSVSQPTNGAVNLSTNRITWDSAYYINHFLVSHNGGAAMETTNNWFSIVGLLTPGDHTFIIIAVDALDNPSLPLTISVVVPTYSVIFRNDNAVFETRANLANLNDLAAIKADVADDLPTSATHTFGGWVQVGVPANNTVTFEAVWNVIVVQAPTVTNQTAAQITWTGPTGATFIVSLNGELQVGHTGTVFNIPSTLAAGSHTLQIVAVVGGVESSITTFPFVVVATGQAISQVRLVDSEGNISEETFNTLAAALADKVNWEREGYILVWESTFDANTNTMTFTATWVKQTQGEPEPNWVTDNLHWMVLGAGALLALIGIIFVITARKRARPV